MAFSRPRKANKGPLNEKAQLKIEKLTSPNKFQFTILASHVFEYFAKFYDFSFHNLFRNNSKDYASASRPFQGHAMPSVRESKVQN